MGTRVAEGTWHSLEGDLLAPSGSLADPKTIAVIGAMLGLLAVALIDIKRRPASQIRGSKKMWASLSIINWVIGPVAYFVIGRQRS
jgi:ACR3 family arsenite efflux pump ArsB